MNANETLSQNDFVLDVDGIYRHKNVPEVRKAAIQLTNDAFKDQLIVDSLKTTMDLIQNKEHWKKPASILANNMPEAVKYAAAFIFYHGGVEISADNEGKRFGVFSKGYYHYCG